MEVCNSKQNVSATTMSNVAASNATDQTKPMGMKQRNQDPISVSFVSSNAETLTNNLNQLEPTFMYTQIFKEILLEMEHEEQPAVQDLAAYCRELYDGNEYESKIIDEFEQEYSAAEAIWWYTRECFTYKMLNQALRTLDGTIIVNMGFFIRDLHQQLKELRQKQFDSSKQKPFVVYRGQGLSTMDFDKLMKNKDGLMSFNNFLSTSNDRSESLTFAKSVSIKPDLIGILFVMSIDPSISSTTPFASIQKMSYFPDEDEILFSMHTVFRVGKITSLDDNKGRLYQVELQLTADDDQQLRVLTERIAKEIKGSTGWKRLGGLLMKIGQFDKAEELYQALLEKTSDINEQAFFYYCLGTVKDNQGDYPTAVEYFENALEINEELLSANDPILATSYNNIGMVYKNMGEYSKALSFFEKTLEIFEETLPEDHPVLATSYNNIGLVYHNMEEHSKALSFFEKALDIRQKTLPENHPDLAQSYNNIGAVYKDMGEYSKVLVFFQKALAIQEKTLPSNHPLLATTYNNIATGYKDMEEYSKALSFYKKALEIFEKTLPANHPSLATIYNNIAAIYTYMDDYTTALSYYQRALDILHISSPTNHPRIESVQKSIDFVKQQL